MAHLVELAGLAIGGDEGVVGGRVGRVPLVQHALVDCHGLARLPAHVARYDQRVVRAQHRLHALRRFIAGLNSYLSS